MKLSVHTALKEVKCLGGICYLWNAVRMTIFFCTESNGELFLKEHHNYMYQIQGQLAVYELEWVDFVVWTNKGISVQRIPFPYERWEKMLPRLKAFYLNGILPELFSSRVRRGISLY